MRSKRGFNGYVVSFAGFPVFADDDDVGVFKTVSIASRYVVRVRFLPAGGKDRRC